MSRIGHLAVRVVRVLVRLYPRRFFRRYGEEMVGSFRERLLESGPGVGAVLVLLARTVADVMKAAATEWIAPSDRAERMRSGGGG